MPRIAPTVGRVVLLRHAPEALPMAATIAMVNDDQTVNIGFLYPDGSHGNLQRVPLIQDGENPPPGRSYVEWMAYQKGQAAKTEALEARLADTGTPGA